MTQRSLKLRRWTTVCVAVAGLCIWTPASMGHARLISTVPADGQTPTTIPERIVLTFNGSVRVTADAIQVFGPDGSHVEHGRPRVTQHGTRIEQGIDAKQPGSYAVGWRTTSSDGHTERGSFSFTYGSAASDSTNSQQRAASSIARPTTLIRAANIMRSITFLALLLAVGGGLFSAVVAPAWRPQLTTPCLLTLLASLIASYVIDAAITNGTSLAGALSVQQMRVESGNPYGRGALVTGALGVLAIVVSPMLRSASPARPLSVAQRLATIAVFATLGASISLVGHAITSTPVAIRLPLDVIHVIAASLWLGGLLQLWRMSRAQDQDIAAIGRFSRAALICVTLLILTGMYATIAELGWSWHRLTTTSYGHLVLAKLVLYAGTMPFAVMNSTTLLPRLRSHPFDVARLLRMYVAREGTLLVVVVAITGWLVGSDPAA